MIPIFTFIGWKNAGKTTVAARVVAALQSRGLRVGVIKSSHHPDEQVDPATDTGKFQRAGATPVCLLTPNQMHVTRPRPEQKLVDIVHRFFRDVDIVIGEGFKNERHISKIEVTRDTDKLLLQTVNGVIAVVSDAPVPDATVFGTDQIEQIADFLIERTRAQSQQSELEAVLFVNGRKVPMKGFVQEALAGTVHGFVRSLKKTENTKDIEVKILIHSNNEK